jgi:hypothetical protein
VTSEDIECALNQNKATKKKSVDDKCATFGAKICRTFSTLFKMKSVDR